MMLLLCAVSFYVVLFRFCLLNVVYLICVVSIAVVLFSAFLFCYYYFFLYLFVRFGKRGAKSLRGSVMAGLYRVAAAFVQGIQISDFTFILIL